MIKKRRKELMQFYIISDIIAIILSFNLTFWLRFHSNLFGIGKGIPEFGKYFLIIPFLILVHLIHFSYQGYYKVKLRRNRLDDLFLVVLNTIVASIIILMIFSYLSRYGHVDFEVSHIYLLIYSPLVILFIFGFRLLIFNIYRQVYLKKNGLSKVLIAGGGDLASRTAMNLEKYSHFGIEISGFLYPEKKEQVLGNYNDLERVVIEYGITDLFIALPLKEYKTIMKLIEIANNLLIDIRLVPDILQIASLKAGIEHLEGIPIINLGDIPLQGWQLIFKRTIDVIISFFGLIILFPFLFIIAIIIKTTSKGPILYKQSRVGLDNKTFNMLKFRTMINNAEKETGVIWSPENDIRVTKIGKILRKLSIDEFPQLLNVLKGDMSLIGPRPERPELVNKFKDSIPKYMLRHTVKAGMTGWAQVHGLRGNTPLDKRIEFDIFYIQNWSFRMDLEILWRTVLKFQFIDKTDSNKNKKSDKRTT